MAIPACGAVAMLAADAYLVIRGIDRNAYEAEVEKIRAGVSLLGELHASEQIGYSIWDEAFQNVVVTPNSSWIERNFGREEFSKPDEVEILILDGNDKAVFSSAAEGPPEQARADDIASAASLAVARVREMYGAARRDDRDFGERLPGALAEGIFFNDFGRVGGRPAFITVSPFAPDLLELAAPEQAVLLIGVHYMSPSLLAKLTSMAHVSAITLAGNEDHAGTSGRFVLPDKQGRPVVTLLFPITLPGVAVLRAQEPVVATSLALIIAMTALCIHAMRRLSRSVAQSEQAALYASRHDAATGLANRAWFMARLADLLKEAKAQAQAQAQPTRFVVLIDCDYFKRINDTLGHQAGDAVIKAVAARMGALGAAIDIAGRIGGDEFALVSAPLSGSAATAAFLGRTSSALMQPVEFAGHRIDVSVSIGAAELTSSAASSIEQVLSFADRALYRAKNEGRGRTCLFSPDLDDEQLGPAKASRNLRHVARQPASTASAA